MDEAVRRIQAQYSLERRDLKDVIVLRAAVKRTSK